MTKIRMRVLEPFNKNLDGQMVTGHPDHPMPEHRFVFVSQEAADILERDKLAEPYSYTDEARDNMSFDENEVDEHVPETRGEPQRTTAVAKREQRVAGATQKPGRRLKTGRKLSGGVPAGGMDTTATTNHPPGTTTGKGATPDPDAAP